MEEPEEYVDPEIGKFLEVILLFNKARLLRYVMIVAKRRALHARIDNIIKKPKGTARKKNKGQQDDVRF